MFSGLRDEFRALVAIVFLLARIGQDGCNAQNSTGNSSGTFSYDELMPTYRTGIEILLQEILGSISSDGSSSSESRSSESSSSSEGFVESIINSVILQPVKDILEPIGNATLRGFGDILNLVEDDFHAIYPGTLWCGGGNIASSEEDVGIFGGTDSCCRAHDNCPQNIAAGSSLGPLLNDGAFTRSACFCDRDFYNCLKNVSSIVSTKIGTTYFNILRPQCFDLDYPITGCAKHGSNRLVKRKCVDYNYNKSAPKTLEWFDNPDY